MGLTFANITLQNGDDVSDFNRGKIGEEEIRQIIVKVMADIGSIMLVINETIREYLGLTIVGHRKSQLANGKRICLPVAGAVLIKYLDRECLTRALVLPDDQEPLLGAIPMKEMDLYVNPGRNELLPVHPEGPVMSLK